MIHVRQLLMYVWSRYLFAAQRARSLWMGTRTPPNGKSFAGSICSLLCDLSAIWITLPTSLHLIGRSRQCRYARNRQVKHTNVPSNLQYQSDGEERSDTRVS
jgi:hypothetical protein